MLVNLPAHLRAASPPNAGSRPIYLEPFGDGSGFAFNAEHPSGVKYLSPDAFAAYSRLLEASGGATPRVDPQANALHADLVQHGIASAADGAAPPSRRQRSGKQFTVWFHISNACNLACSYCYIPKLEKAADPQSMARHFMPAPTIAAATLALFEFCRHHRIGHLHIKFAGGEPTLDVDRIDTTCDAAALLAEPFGIQLSFSILTNGVFIDPRIIAVLKKHRFAVSISLDGGAEAHDRMRFGTPRSLGAAAGAGKKTGTFETIDANIGRLLAAGIRPYILCTVSAQNYRDLRGLIDYTLARRIGFRLSLVRDRHAHAKPDLARGILAALIEAYAWLGRNMPADMPIERFARFAEWDPEVKKAAVCGTCKNSVAIDQKGQVASCQMRLDKPHGNVNDEALTGIFARLQTAEENRYLAYTADKTGDCAICYWKFSCAGGCPEHSRLALGTPNAPSPWCGVYSAFYPHYLRAIATQIKSRIDPKPAPQCATSIP